MKHEIVSDWGSVYLLEYVSKRNIKLFTMNADGSINKKPSKYIIENELLITKVGYVSDRLLKLLAERLELILRRAYGENIKLQYQSMIGGLNVGAIG